MLEKRDWQSSVQFEVTEREPRQEREREREREYWHMENMCSTVPRTAARYKEYTEANPEVVFNLF